MTKKLRRIVREPLRRTGQVGGVRRWGRSLLLTLVYMIALVVTVAPVALLNVRWLTLIAGAAIWLIGSAVMALYVKDGFDVWAFVCAVIPVMMTAYNLPDYLALRATTTVRVETVADIQPPIAGRAFDFDQAKIQTRYTTIYQATSNSGRTTARSLTVAPLTTWRWQSDQLVLAWVGCINQSGATCVEWAERNRVGVLASDWDQADLHLAVEQAVKRYDLQTAADAPIFIWSKSAQVEAEQTLNTIGFAGLLGYGLWAVLRSVDTIWRAARAQSDSPVE